MIPKYLTDNDIRRLLKIDHLPPTFKVPKWKLAILPEVLNSFKYRVHIPSQSYVTDGHKRHMWAHNQFFNSLNSARQYVYSLREEIDIWLPGRAERHIHHMWKSNDQKKSSEIEPDTISKGCTA